MLITSMGTYHVSRAYSLPKWRDSRTCSRGAHVVLVVAARGTGRVGLKNVARFLRVCLETWGVVPVNLGE